MTKFTEVVLNPQVGNFEEKAENLSKFSDKIVGTAKMVAVGTANANKKISEEILAVSSQIESLTPQLINAGRIKLAYGESNAADEHFNNLKSQYSQLLHQERSLLGKFWNFLFECIVQMGQEY